MGSVVPRRSTAFAPGHVTGVFMPSLDAPDPRARGSTGAGLVLELGATAEAVWTAGPARSIRVEDGDGGLLPISRDVAERLTAGQRGRLVVRVRHELPVGQGFGMSAAGAVATALAVGRLESVPRGRAAEVAHLADLFGGGGLGGVAAILGGGVEVRLRPGVPPWGTVLHFPSDARVLVGVVGPPIPSPAILRSERWIDRIRRAADGLEPIAARGDIGPLFDASERFTDRLGLASRPVRDILRGIRRRGGRAAQAMFGASFFAYLPDERTRARVVAWLATGRVRAVETGLDRRGARGLGVSLLEGGPSPPRP